jgi:hypothetical protein
MPDHFYGILEIVVGPPLVVAPKTLGDDDGV